LIYDELVGKVKSQPQRFALNHEIAERERGGLPVQPPGLPSVAGDAALYITDDCVRFIQN